MKKCFTFLAIFIFSFAYTQVSYLDYPEFSPSKDVSKEKIKDIVTKLNEHGYLMYGFKKFEYDYENHRLVVFKRGSVLKKGEWIDLKHTAFIPMNVPISSFVEDYIYTLNYSIEIHDNSNDEKPFFTSVYSFGYVSDVSKSKLKVINELIQKIRSYYFLNHNIIEDTTKWYTKGSSRGENRTAKNTPYKFVDSGFKVDNTASVSDINFSDILNDLENKFKSYTSDSPSLVNGAIEIYKSNKINLKRKLFGYVAKNTNTGYTQLILEGINPCGDRNCPEIESKIKAAGFDFVKKDMELSMRRPTLSYVLLKNNEVYGELKAFFNLLVFTAYTLDDLKSDLLEIAEDGLDRSFANQSSLGFFDAKSSKVLLGWNERLHLTFVGNEKNYLLEYLLKSSLEPEENGVFELKNITNKLYDSNSIKKGNETFYIYKLDDTYIQLRYHIGRGFYTFNDVMEFTFFKTKDDFEDIYFPNLIDNVNYLAKKEKEKEEEIFKRRQAYYKKEREKIKERYDFLEWKDKLGKEKLSEAVTAVVKKLKEDPNIKVIDHGVSFYDAGSFKIPKRYKNVTVILFSTAIQPSYNISECGEIGAYKNSHIVKHNEVHEGDTTLIDERLVVTKDGYNLYTCVLPESVNLYTFFYKRNKILKGRKGKLERGEMGHIVYASE